MSIYDKASLVLIPSGTKTSKVYSQKPVSGDGDFTFSRSTAATRVNASGNIEKETQNLAKYSNDFSNSVWYKYTNTTYTLTTETITDPFGVSTSVYKVTLTGSGYVTLRQEFSGDARYMTASAYIKKSSSGLNVALDQSDGDVTNSASNTDWQRLSSSHASGYSFSFVDITITGVSGDYFYVSSAQMELGGAARDYIETTAAAVEGGITDNVPRLDYTDSSCPSLKLEPQRTNQLAHSEYLGGWTSGTFTPTISSVTSPEGVNNAYTLPFTNSAGSNIYTFATLSSTNEHIFSIYAKVGSGTKTFRVRAEYGGTSVTSSDFTATSTWQRFEFAFTPTATNIVAYIFNGSNGEDSDLEVYGIQVESGSYATSYIPTYGSSVTRAADFSSNNDLVDTPIAIGANDDFALYYEGSFDKDGRNEIIMGGGVVGAAADSKCYWWVRATDLFLVGNGEATMASASFTAVKNTNYKILVKRNGSAIDTFVNGTKLSTTQGATNTAFTFRSLGWSYNNSVYKISGSIKQAMIFKTGLTEQEAIDLTTI